jgi:hypothetical protein
MKKDLSFKIRLIMGALIFLLLTYSFYYFVFLNNQYKRLLDVQRTLGEGSSYELIISGFEKDQCQITYCVFNNCDNVVSLPCSKLQGNEFKGSGNYRLELDTGRHVLYPWGNKEIIKSWEIVATNSSQQERHLDSYISSLKGMLSHYYLWEIYSIPISDSNLNLNNLYTLEQVNLDFDYTKSLYLLSLLSNQYEDQKLQNIWQEELSYLNKNIEDILDYQQNNIFPSAYLLKLVDLGLDEKYLTLLENFEVFDYGAKEVINYENSREPLLLNKELYSSDYRDMMHYSDNYKIFLEYGYDNLSGYSYYQAISAYNSSKYSVYGICSIQNSMEGLMASPKLQAKLEKTFTNSVLNLIEGNIYELLMCKKFATQESIEIKGLESSIAYLLENLSLNIDDKTILVRGLSPTRNLNKEVRTIVTYNSLDNLMFLINYEE